MVLKLPIRVRLNFLRLLALGVLMHHSVQRNVGLQTGKVSVVITEAHHLLCYLLHGEVRETWVLMAQVIRVDHERGVQLA